MTHPIILHIPHASRFIPRWVRRQLLLDDAQLKQELDRITDHETDTLFDYAYRRSPVFE